MNISVVGLGRLGLPLTAVLADVGFTVVGADTDPEVLDSVRRCEPLFYEPGLQELLRSVRDRIAVVDDAGVAAFVTDVSIVLVPAPSETDGSFSLKYVLDVCHSIGEALTDKEMYHLVIISSTVMPGSCAGEILETLEKTSGLPVGERWGLCYIPEWVALGSVIQGFREPEFVIIGASDKKAARTAIDVYERLCPRRFATTNLTTAELAKIAANCYFVMKISFANQMAELCERLPGVDVDVLTDAIGLDSRVGRKFFTGAGPAAGRCFPRDLRALSAVGRTVNLSLSLVNGVEIVNRQQYWRIGRIVKSDLVKGNVLGVLGVAFKPMTDDRTFSLGDYLIKELKSHYAVIACDPLALGIVSPQECVDQADVVVVTIPCKEFKGLRFREGQTVIDCWRLLDRQAVRSFGAKYVGIGLGEGA